MTLPDTSGSARPAAEALAALGRAATVRAAVGRPYPPGVLARLAVGYLAQQARGRGRPADRGPEYLPPERGPVPVPLPAVALARWGREMLAAVEAPVARRAG